MQARHAATLVSLFILVLVGPAPGVLAGGRPPADLELIEAVKDHDLDAVRALVRDGVNVNETQPDGATALHWAAYREDSDSVSLLVEAGADVHATNELGATPLWVAAIAGNASIIKQLLDAGADANVILPEGETPLMTASRAGKVSAVEELLGRGADPNGTEYVRGQTALMWATAQGHSEVVATLLAHGAEVNARSKIRPRLVFAETVNASQYDQGFVVNEGGFTPLLFAARRGGLESAALLLDAGADVNDSAPAGPASSWWPPTAVTPTWSDSFWSGAPTPTRTMPAIRRFRPRCYAETSR